MGAMKKIENMEKNLENLSPDMFTFAEYDANAAERTGYSNYSYWASTWRVFTKNKVAMFFLTLLIALMMFTFIQPYLPGQKDPIEVNLSEETGKQDRNQPPSADYWFGTNSIGQDLWARIWSGTRTSLFIGLAVGLWDAFMGIIIGSLWGYVRKLDAAITEVYNVIHNIPSSIILILVSYLLKPSVGTIIFAMCLTGWLPTARFIRNQIVIIRDREFNLASASTAMMRLRTPIMLAAMPTQPSAWAVSVSSKSRAMGASSGVAGADFCARNNGSCMIGWIIVKSPLFFCTAQKDACQQPDDRREHPAKTQCCQRQSVGKGRKCAKR